MNGFYNVSYKTQVYERDFTSGEKNGSNATSVFQSFAFENAFFYRSGFIPVKEYRLNGDVYFYCSDKSLRKVSGNTFINAYFSSDVAPLIIPVVYGGAKKIMFVGKSGNTVKAQIDGESISGVPYGSSFAFYGGRLFIADKNRLYFSEEFDFTEFTVGTLFSGFLETDEKSGDVLYLFGGKDGINIVCKKGIYLLTPYGEATDFTLKKVPTFYLEIAENSVCESGDAVYFLSGKMICVLSGNSVKSVGKAALEYNFIGGVSGVTDGIYCLPITVNGNRFLYAYDTFSGVEKIISAGNFYPVGSYAYKTSDNTVYTVKRKYEQDSVTDASLDTEVDFNGDYDLGTCLKKAVCGIEAHITGSATINLTGDSSFSATITEKCNSVSCFVHGRSFNITFTEPSADFTVKKIRIRYVAYGG